MSKRGHKIGHAAHIKKHTVGTSNEISFSVLDAAKNQLGLNDIEGAPVPRFGGISLFTLPRRKKTVTTPTKEKGLPLSTGEFASADAGSNQINSSESNGLGSSIQSSDELTKKNNPRTLITMNSPSTTSSNTGLIVAKTPRVMRSPEEEIARRKGKRRRRRILAAALIAVIGLGLAGIGGVYVYQDNQRHVGQVTQLNDALDLVTQADETVVKLNMLVARPLEATSLKELQGVSARIPEVRSQLDEADRVARTVSMDMRESSDKEAANQTVAAIAGRLAMIDAGMEIMSQASSANESAQTMRSTWQKVVEGDGFARQAAALVADTTDEHVRASKEKTQAALAAFVSARDSFDQLASVQTKVDLRAQQAYIEKRIEAMSYAIASDDAFLEKNKENAVAQNDAYNQADSEAASLAISLPSDAAQPIFDMFEREIVSWEEMYSTARLQAGSADAFIRDYLGTSSK